MSEKVDLDHVSYTVGGMTVLRDVSLSLRRGETVVIAGRSGHGKSTLLELCAGLRMPTRGTVNWDGVPLSRMGREQLSEWRRGIGYMFQQHALISNLFIFDNIALPLRYHHEVPEAETRARVRAAMEECGLFGLDRCFPEALSFGQQRRAALARALVTEPDVLLLDEPTGGLDPLAEEGIFNILSEVRGRRPTLLVMVSNALAALRRLDPRVLVLESGTMFDMDALPPDAGRQVPFIAAAAALMKRDFR